MLKNLAALGYTRMTPIQHISLPVLLQHKDILAQAKTGTGKTVAFGIGLLSALKVKQFRIQSLVLCPTRELAEQVSHELRRLARFADNIKILTLCGGKPFGPQLGSLEHGAHVIVGTPGRINQHLRKGSLQLGFVETLVLDEADRMLDMGFLEQISTIIEELPLEHTTWLFSATFPDSIRQLSHSIQAETVEVNAEASSADFVIDQLFYRVSGSGKQEALEKILSHYHPSSVLIFCNTRQRCQQVVDSLRDRSIRALALHGEMEQRDRDQALIQFANGSVRVLVATDLASRGLDVKDLGAVIVYDLSRDVEVHIHRIGRTGRAGASGLAISLYTDAETDRLETIESYQKKHISRKDVGSLDSAGNRELESAMRTVCIAAGRKQKIRPTDILGALTGDVGLESSAIGKIDIRDHYSYIAIESRYVATVLQKVAQGKIKGRKVKIRKL
jgi:ATP-independent RNA helicase DbpA